MNPPKRLSRKLVWEFAEMANLMAVFTFPVIFPARSGKLIRKCRLMWIISCY